MSRFTILFERLAVDVLKECDVTGAGRLLRTSWDETWHVMERAVARGLRVKEPVAPVRLGVDEVSWRKGQNDVTIVRPRARLRRVHRRRAPLSQSGRLLRALLRRAVGPYRGGRDGRANPSPTR